MDKKLAQDLIDEANSPGELVQEISGGRVYKKKTGEYVIIFDNPNTDIRAYIAENKAIAEE